MFAMYVGMPSCGTSVYSRIGIGDGMCDVRNPAAELQLTMYHVRVGGVSCVPPSSLTGSDPSELGYTGP